MSRLRQRALSCLVCAAAVCTSGALDRGLERPISVGGAGLEAPFYTRGLGVTLIPERPRPALGAGSSSVAPGRSTPPPLAAEWVVAPPRGRSAPAVSGPSQPARVLWRFRSASPVSGSPAVSSRGLVYVASVEGYVHALGPDGHFRWSYGLRGIPLGAPAVDDAGGVYVATSEGRLYALGADGQLVWALGAFCRFASSPVWAEGSLHLVGRDHNLYSVPRAGGPPSRTYLGEPAGAELASVGAGLIALGTARAALLYRRTIGVARLELGAPLSQPLLGGGERWLAVTAEGVAAFDSTTHERLWSAPARRVALSADQHSLVVEADRELRWLSPRTGEVLGRAPLPGDVSAAPALTNAGVALVPMVSGELWVVDPLAPSAASIGVGSAPLWAPVYDEASRRIIVAAGGSVVALELAGGAEAWEPAGHADGEGGA